MKKIIALLFVVAPLVVLGQLSTNENYIESIIYKKAFTESTIGSATGEDRIENVVYYDGIGRAKQSISVGQGGNKEHIISHFEYDHLGRQAKSFLPFAIGNGTNSKELVLNPLQKNMSFYKTAKYEDTDYPYSLTKFEKSSSSRVLATIGPGNIWHSKDKATKIAYKANSSNDAICNFDVIFINNDVKQPKLEFKGFFSANELHKTIVKNENWSTNDQDNRNTVHSFSDKLGRTILTRSFTETIDSSNGNTSYTPVDTYNVYDDFGNLTYVLSPKAVENLFSNTVLLDYSTVSIGSYPLINKGTTLKTGDVSASIAISQSQLTFNIHSTLSHNNYLQTGPIFEIPNPTPDMVIGVIGTMGSEVTGGYGYTFSVENNHLVIQGAGNIARNPDFILDQTFTVNIPVVPASIDDLVVKNLGYQYKYDSRNRLIERKVPNAEWESIVYDKLNRPVLTQDAKLATEGKWLFVKYDVFNRAVYTGLYISNETREVLQNSLDNQTVFNESRTSTTILDGTSINYSNVVFPTVGLSLLNITYYDQYNTQHTPSSVQTLGQTVTNNTKGVVTETKERILNTNEWISSIVYYDVKAKPIFTTSNNTYLNTQDEVGILYNFVGSIDKTIHKHTFSANNLVIVTEDEYTYDHQNRMLTQYQTIKDGAGIEKHSRELISKNTYDELGRVTKVSVGNTELSPLQNIDYVFNIRGWLKEINKPNENLTNDVFAMEINYTSVSKDVSENVVLNNKALFNGNISEVHYKTASDGKKRSYGYSYDNLNRLTKASYKAGNSFNEEVGFYNLNSISYDVNGNIKQLSRNAPNSGFNGALEIDNLNYEYHSKSNQLKQVTDATLQAQGFDNGTSANGQDYHYDVNGNVTKDENKDISNITFNYLNLPETITVSGKGTMSFVYSASGKKQEKTTINNTTGTHKTAYAGKFIYTKPSGATNFSLSFFSTPQGYVESNLSGTAYNYVYQYKDHQGNIRVSYSDYDKDGVIDVFRNGGDIDGDGDNKSEIVQAKNYYPFGLDHNYGATNVMSIINGKSHRYKYNGKEQEKALGLNVTEMDWRQYDNALGRFNGIDKLAATEPYRTPYHFAGNNPIVFSDPSGLKRIAGSNADQYDGIRQGYRGWHRERATGDSHWSKNLMGMSEFGMTIGGDRFSSGGGGNSNNSGSALPITQGVLAVAQGLAVGNDGAGIAAFNILFGADSVTGTTGLDVGFDHLGRPYNLGEGSMIGLNEVTVTNGDYQSAANDVAGQINGLQGSGDSAVNSSYPPNRLNILFRDISNETLYPGVKIYESPLMQGAGVTLPGIGIIIKPGYNRFQKKALLQHEYGHFLDYKFTNGASPIYNLDFVKGFDFYLTKGIPSLLNTIPGFNSIPGLNGPHHSFWTETRADKWAELFFRN